MSARRSFVLCVLAALAGAQSVRAADAPGATPTPRPTVGTAPTPTAAPAPGASPAAGLRDPFRPFNSSSSR
jgi:hypothetical protein